MRSKGWRIVAAVLIALVVGVGSGLARLRWFVSLGGVDVGPWQTSTAIGSSSADALLRAAIAVNAILAMNRDEAVYFIARDDSAGKPLDGACRYRVSGTDPEARWWSLTVYGSDRFLVPNPQHRYSESLDSVHHDSNGHFDITLARQPQDGNWIALPDGRFLLTLRLYNPSPALVADPSRAQLPTIVAEGCR